MSNFDPNNVITQTPEASLCVVQHKDDVDYQNLSWLLQSPDLFDLMPTSAAFVNLRSFIAPKEVDCVEIKQGFNSTQRRLGLYAEDLLSHYFSMASSTFTLLARNLQVFGQGREGKKTQGEFDFILMNLEQKRYYHLELACKFYLGVKPKSCDNNVNKSSKHGETKALIAVKDSKQRRVKASKMNQWVGPGCNDRLDIKVGRLLEHQLLLSQSCDGQKRLNDLGVSPVELRYLLKGQFFYPAFTKLEPPSDAGENHLKGLWWSQDECAAVVKELTSALGPWRFTQLYNIEYMAPRQHHLYENPSLGQGQFLDFVSRHFSESGNSRWSKKLSGRQNHKSKSNLETRPLSLCIEPEDNVQSNIYLKVFIVPSNWAEAAREYSKI